MQKLQDVLNPNDNNFNAIRLIAAATVVVGHASIVVTGDKIFFPFLNLQGFDVGGYAVNIFFVLSGLVITASLDRSKDLVRFAMARFMRLIPAVVAYTIFAAFVIGPLFTTMPLGSYFLDSRLSLFIIKTIGALSSYGGLPGVFADMPDNGRLNVSMWTIKYEIVCYVGVACLGMAGMLKSSKRIALVLAAFAVVTAVIFMRYPDAMIDEGMPGHIVRFGTCFLLGVCAYHWRARILLTGWIMFPLLAALLLPFPAPCRLFVEYGVLGYATLYIGSLPMPVLRDLCNRYDLSYGTYIYGWLWLVLVATVIPGLSTFGLAAIALVCTLAMASLSWHFVERPALSMLKKHRTGAPVAAARDRGARLSA